MLLSVTSGCSLCSPSHETISVQVAEPHAQVWINGSYVGEAPAQASVMRNHNVGVMVKKVGFQTSMRTIDYHLSTTGTLDLIGGIIFLAPAIGFVSPGAYSLDETVLILQLVAEEKPAVPVSTAK